MAAQPDYDRRALLRGGLAATAAGAVGLSAAGTANAATESAEAAQPRIYSTAQWGARAPSSAIVIQDHRPTYIAIHHTADANSHNYSLTHAKTLCRAIQNYHMDHNGWADTGQQFTNTRGGYRLEGRHHSLAAVRGGTHHVQGANVGGYNSKVIGIENEGVYSKVNVPNALWNSLVPLVAWIADRYGTQMKNIRGHRDFNSTDCPGDVLYGRLKELRAEVARRLGVTEGPEVLTWPLLRPGAAGPRVRAAQYLLRARGLSGVPVDGVFGTATTQAVARLAEVHGTEHHACSAMHHSTVDETGYLGSDIWPLITPSVQTAGNSDVAEAVSTLTRRGSGTAPSTRSLSQADWQRLLA